MLLSKALGLLLNDEEIFIECSYFIPQHLWPNLCQIDDSVIGQGVLKFIHTWRMYIVWFVTKTQEQGSKNSERQKINSYSRNKQPTVQVHNRSRHQANDQAQRGK